MSQVSILGACGCDAEDCEIVTIESDSDEVVVLYEPGPPGPPAPPWVNSGSRTSPVLISTTIPITSDPVLRVFIASSGAPAIDPAMVHIAGNYRIILFGTSNTHTVSIGKNSSNFELSGQWVARSGSILAVDWDGVSKYTEAYRNEI